MDTIQIMEIIKRMGKVRRIFIGVYPIDKIGKVRMVGKWACIVNTAPSTHPGEHWVGIIRVDKYPEYYDSYGLPPPNIIHKKLSRHYKKYKYNHKQVQGNFATTCGAHCIYFIHKRINGDMMETITKNVTDKKVHLFIQSFYSPDHETDEEIEYHFQIGK